MIHFRETTKEMAWNCSRSCGLITIGVVIMMIISMSSSHLFLSSRRSLYSSFHPPNFCLFISLVLQLLHCMSLNWPVYIMNSFCALSYILYLYFWVPFFPEAWISCCVCKIRHHILQPLEASDKLTNLHILKVFALKSRFCDGSFSVRVLNQHLIRGVTKFNRQIFRDDRGDHNGVF